MRKERSSRFALERETDRRRPRRPIAAMLACLFAAALVLGWLIGVCDTAVAAGQSGTLPSVPTAWTLDVRPLEEVARVLAPEVDLEAVRREDAEREADGLPSRFAIANPVHLTPATAGTWEELLDGRRLWRLRIASPGALSLNLGFTRYRMPPGGLLFVHAADRSGNPRRFTAADNREHGQLWTPVVLDDDIVVEMTLPAGADDHELELTSINVGYRFFGEPAADKSGACNVDVVCPEGDDWRDEIQSVAAYSTGGSIICTGFMVNNTAEDGTPYFMTAFHCNVDVGNAASLVVYWNYHSPGCGDHGGGQLDHFQTGSQYVAGNSLTDFKLLRLDTEPDTEFRVAYAGWNRTAADPTSAVAIHHPSGDEKSISFENDPCTTTRYMSTIPGDSTHIRVEDWDVGTTEPGSSGSPLFNQDHQVVGQLHGGYAACGNDLADWYGRFSKSWYGGGTTMTSLHDWLDPEGLGVETLGHLVPGASGLRVTPLDELVAHGDNGGPFTPASLNYTLLNRGDESIDFSVATDADWIEIDPAGGTLAGNGSVSVTVAIGAGADSLVTGLHVAEVEFENVTEHIGDTMRLVEIWVGTLEAKQTYSLSVDPGWTTEGDWAFGRPLGLGGVNGEADPTNGYTGSNVYGYNLQGDYDPGTPARHLTSSAIDCTDLSGVNLRFQRWLGVGSSSFDHASVSVSNNGSDFTQVWENTDEVTDVHWMPMEFDIHEIADGQPEVYLRWTMGPTSLVTSYCGWNIDDIALWALAEADTSDDGIPDRTFVRANYPNPLNQGTTIVFDLHNPGLVKLRIYDLRGRLIKHLLSAELEADRHEWPWDGTDDQGRLVSSGAYVCRLEAVGVQHERKMVVVR